MEIQLYFSYLSNSHEKESYSLYFHEVLYGTREADIEQQINH